MARPTKCRRICSMPENIEFSPGKGSTETVIMGMDEYETIRLIDHEGLTQEECARQMNVARPTITMIYENARQKLAEALIQGKHLVIEGGNVTVCGLKNKNCCGKCGRSNCSRSECGTCHNQQR